MTPLALWLGPRVSPNVVSILALIVGVLAAVLAARGMKIPSLLAWLGARLLDATDGVLARANDRQTDFGGYLDIVLDHVAYAVIPIGLLVAYSTPELAIMTALLMGSFFVNAASWMYLAAILERRNDGAKARGELTTITMPPGIIAGAETIVFFSAFLVFPGHLIGLYALMGSLVIVNVIQRLAWASRALRPSPTR